MYKNVEYFIKPLKITIKRDEEERDFVISKFPAVEGREIIAGYPLTALPKFSEYGKNEEIMFKCLSYSAIEKRADNGELIYIPIRDKQTANKFVPSWEMLVFLEKEMLKYNCSFFRDGSLKSFLGDISQMLPSLISKTLTASSEQLSQVEKQPFES